MNRINAIAKNTANITRPIKRYSRFRDAPEIAPPIARGQVKLSINRFFGYGDSYPSPPLTKSPRGLRIIKKARVFSGSSGGGIVPDEFPTVYGD